MRDLTWQMFELTGDIDAYLLYRACDGGQDESAEDLAEETISGETEIYRPQ